MKLLMRIFLVSIGVLSSFAYADIIMQWQRTPLQIDLNLEQERIVFVDRNIKVGYPPTLDNKLRIQNAGGVLYLKALKPFEKTRLQLQDLSNGEIILLDISSEENSQENNALEPVKLVYSDGSKEKEQSDEQIARSDTTLPIPAALTRYAAQSLYAPLRTVEPLVGVQSVTPKLPSNLKTLLPRYPFVSATLLTGWKLGNYVVTAVKLQNHSAQRIELDPRDLNGHFYAATFQHHFLGVKNSPSDTTTVYLITEGDVGNAIIPNPIIKRPIKK
ncbi:integrating conjugative element protein [Mergibacter septicus]|uniref:Integrating conjugative element protein n=1 Tax=Mergibacter septicus TaxID=221402 RepID=A0A8E3S7Q7_9PAST|nr:TIGR03749 family integrating conjugative element protein [Mergibacter septicus]AWX14717.1 integrating conjugative element protein [Mergibacter septicus]QDJ13968.1 integrating conjugative element protein [Mergibacter septicus]UTU48582.1 TIGR03749 family integrating conjugative element protein [Mergibacter septicus]WMR95788.1 TIGR03749 family integrating conjugative element protein [Mergibacter septicus]